MGKEDINRLKEVLVEHKRTTKWLTEQAGRAPAAVSKWCTNTVQPKHDTLRQVADILDLNLDFYELFETLTIFNPKYQNQYSIHITLFI